MFTKLLNITLFSLSILLASCSNGSDGDGNSTGDSAVICEENCTSVTRACMGHGGVNCAAGPDTDGSVICVDGWRNSNVDYVCQ